VHLPVYISWLNQLEIYFSILRRKVLTPNEMTDLDALTQRVLAIQDQKFTRIDLDKLLNRITAHSTAHPEPLAA
jgi:hypothetical protein